MQKHWDVMRSDDAGDSWHEVSGNLPTDFGFAIDVHAHEPETIYVVPIKSDSEHFPPDGTAARLPQPHGRQRVGGTDERTCRSATATSTCCAMRWPSTRSTPAASISARQADRCTRHLMAGTLDSQSSAICRRCCRSKCRRCGRGLRAEGQGLTSRSGVIMIRVILPQHLRTLARVGSEIEIQVGGQRRCAPSSMRSRPCIRCCAARSAMTGRSAPAVRAVLRLRAGSVARSARHAAAGCRRQRHGAVPRRRGNGGGLTARLKAGLGRRARRCSGPLVSNAETADHATRDGHAGVAGPSASMAQRAGAVHRRECSRAAPSGTGRCRRRVRRAHGRRRAEESRAARSTTPCRRSTRSSAGGVNMWAPRDEFQFAWKRMTGDFILQARVEFLGTGVDPHRKAGWIVRRDDGCRLRLRGRRGARRRPDRRCSTGARRARSPSRSSCPIKGADVIQIERAGGTYTFSAARYGEPFTTAQIADVDLGDDVMVGLALCSHNPDVTERAVFRDVRIIRPAPADFVPYRDFIGSVLEILDVESGHRQEIFRSEQPFEAPNWTRDGGGADLQPQRPRRGLGRPVPLRPADAAVHADRHRRRQPQQQRPRALVRRHDARHQRSEPVRRRAVDRVHGAGRRRHAEAHHDRVAVVPARLVARREAADLHGRAQRRVRHLQHPVGRQRPGGQADRLSRGSTTARSTRPTGSTSTSTRCAAARCRSGA